jgi:hypothetical protein
LVSSGDDGAIRVFMGSKITMPGNPGKVVAL